MAKHCTIAGFKNFFSLSIVFDMNLKTIFSLLKTCKSNGSKISRGIFDTSHLHKNQQNYCPPTNFVTKVDGHRLLTGILEIKRELKILFEILLPLTAFY